nr:MAG TPA: hypothetical protein [Caudoviricetes sp.]
MFWMSVIRGLFRKINIKKAKAINVRISRHIGVTLCD